LLNVLMNIPTPKLILLASAFSLAAAFAVPALRAEDAPKEKKVSARVLKKYDTNKDGKLDDQERAAWEADKAQQKAKRKAKKQAQKEGAEAPAMDK